jgi:hypothetical protein
VKRRDAARKRSEEFGWFYNLNDFHTRDKTMEYSGCMQEALMVVTFGRFDAWTTVLGLQVLWGLIVRVLTWLGGLCCPKIHGW